MQLKKYLMMIIILMIGLTIKADEFELINIYKENIGFIYDKLEPIKKSEDLIYGYILNLKEIDDDLSYLSLGSVKNYDLIEKLSIDIGIKIKSYGFDFIIFGNLEILKKDTENPLNYIGKSPYINSEIMYRMIRGFETSGLYPIINVGSNDDKSFIDSLLQKTGSFLSYSDTLKNVDIYKSDNIYTLLKNYNLKLPWTLNNNNLDESLLNIYKNSIVISGHLKGEEEILLNKINNSNYKKITYFSNKVKDLAEKTLRGEILPTGNKNW
ncbi:MULTISPECIES: hypothetical protein [Oceanotoga]|nr:MULTISPECIES: hypothetical protein [Oceanotoga]